MSAISFLSDLFGAAGQGASTYLDVDNQMRERKRQEENDAAIKSYRAGQLANEAEGRRINLANLTNRMASEGWVPDEKGDYVHPETGQRGRLDYTRSTAGQRDAAIRRTREEQTAADERAIEELMTGLQDPTRRKGAWAGLVARGVNLPDGIERSIFGLPGREVDPQVQLSRELMNNERSDRAKQRLLASVSSLLERNGSPITSEAVSGLIRSVPGFAAQAKALNLGPEDIMGGTAGYADRAESGARRALGDSYDPSSGTSAYDTVAKGRGLRGVSPQYARQQQQDRINREVTRIRREHPDWSKDRVLEELQKSGGLPDMGPSNDSNP